MVAQVLAFQALLGLVLRHRQARPFLVDKVGEQGKLLPRRDAVLGPIVGEFVARLLPGHALLDPLVAAPELLPGLAGAVECLRRVCDLLHALVTYLGQPQLDGFGLGTGDGLHQAQQALGGGAVGQVVLAVCSGQFQSVTSCHRLTALLGKAPLELVPVLAGCLIVSLLGQHLYDIDDRKPPGVRGFVVQAADRLAIELGGQDFHVSPVQQRRRNVTPGAACTWVPTSTPCPSNVTP